MGAPMGQPTQGLLAPSTQSYGAPPLPNMEGLVQPMRPVGERPTDHQVIATLLPSAYGLMASYQLHQLQQEHQRLVGEQSRLELEEATLVSPERLQRLAKDEGFTDPTPDHTVYLTPKNESSLALNRE